MINNTLGVTLPNQQWSDWTRTTSRKNQHIQTWLKFNRSVHDSNEVILEQFLNEIPKVFKGYCNMLNFISKFATKQQIEDMHNLLQKVKIKNESSAIKKQEDDEDSTIIDIVQEGHNNKPNPFHLLPTESISHICSYLGRSSINIFKCMCRQLGIICLEEQTKIAVSVFNADELINNNNMNLCDFKRDKFRKTRHNSNKRIYSFIEEWSETYNIPFVHQLIALFSRYEARHPCICDLTPRRLETMHTISRRGFLILDKRKIIIINQNEARLLNIAKDSMEKLKDYKLIILEYFNVLQQECNVIQFLLCHKDVTYLTILEYIEHKYIHIQGMDHKWHTSLLLILKQMNYNAQCPKLCMFQHVDSYDALKIIEDIDVNKALSKYCSFTMQLNPRHDWFNSTDKLDSIKEICARRLDAFHINAKTFCNNVINAHLYYKGNKDTLRTAVQRYYQEQFNEQERDVFDEDIKDSLTVIDGLNTYARSIRTSKTSKSGSARIKVAQLFQNIVRPNNIELFDYNYQRRKHWFDELGYEIRFGIVLYDTEQFSFDAKGEKLYRVRVHALNKGAYPFKLRGEDATILTVKYKKKFKVRKFVNDIFSQLEKSKEHILRYQYDDTLAIYFKNRKKLERNRNITCVLTERNEDYYVGKLQHIRSYGMNDEFVAGEPSRSWELDRNTIKKLNLYLMETENDDDTKYKLKIKFVSNLNVKFNAKTAVKDLTSIQWVGMPLIAWIDRGDTLQQILNTYLDEETRKMIQYTYRVIVGTKVVSIAKSKRISYKPYYEFLKYNEKDYIVLLLPKSKTQEKELPIFSPNVHKALHN